MSAASTATAAKATHHDTEDTNFIKRDREIMRQGQQHRRGRSRGGQQGNHGNSHSSSNNGNNNRKGQNPISRNYQSNGPDGKVSGTASSIAEKYLSLARDAHTAGDPVLAENYLQHAEHYNRIILAYRETQTGDDQRPASTGDASDAGDTHGDDDGETYGRDMQPLPPMEIAPRPVRNDPLARNVDQPPRNADQPRPFDTNRPERSDRSDRQPDRPDGQRFDERQPRFNTDQQRRPQRDRFEPRERYGADRADRGNGQERQERFNNANNSERGAQDRGASERFNGPRPDRPQQDRDRPQNERFDRNRDRDGNRDGNRERPQGDRFGGERPQPDRVAADMPRELPREAVSERQPASGFMSPRSDVPVPRADGPAQGGLPLPTPMASGADQPVAARAEPALRAPRAPRRERAPTPVAEHEQPEFLRRPVRRPRRDAAAAEGGDDATPSVPAPDREPDHQ